MSCTIDQFNAMFDSLPADKDAAIEYLRDRLFPRGVKVTHEVSTDDSSGLGLKRVMLSMFDRKVSYRFSGTIMGVRDGKMKAVAVHPQPTQFRFKRKQVEQAVRRHTSQIVEANDGTTVTLYWFDGEWVISTYRGYRVNDFIWFGDLTYQQVLDEVFAKYDGFSYESLQKTHCYTIGFRHPSFHPFQVNEGPSAWFIRSVDMQAFRNNEMVVSRNTDIGIPVQKKVHLSANALFSRSAKAYDDYVGGGQPNYGYIVIDRDVNYYIESSLMRHIRSTFYSNRFKNLDSEIDKKVYSVVSSYLHKRNHEVIKNLFPQYDSLYDKLDLTATRVIDEVVQIVKDPSAYEPTNTIQRVSLGYYRKLVETMIFSGDVDVSDMVMVDLYNPRNTPMLYELVAREL
jgi:hypothetical protein